MTSRLLENFLTPQASTQYKLERLRRIAEQRRAGSRRIGLLDWVQQHRRELIPDRFFDLASHPYLADIYNETARELVLYKAGQVGISEYLLSYALYSCDIRNATTLYIFPNNELVNDFSAARLGPAIEASDYLRRIVIEGAAESGKKGADRITLKRIRNRFLYFRGGQVKKDGKSAQLKSIDADVIVLDELDEMDPRAPSIAQKRLGHSKIAETRWASTPSFPGRGIHEKWGESDRRLWFIPCPSCGQKQDVQIGDIVTEFDQIGRPHAWHGMKDGEAFAACRHCGARLDRGASGEWVATAQSDIAGYHVTKLIAPDVDLTGIVKALETTDETKRREAYNQDLGLPYQPRGGGLSDDILDQCRREYLHSGVSKTVCFMGVDVGKVLNVVVRAGPHEETGERAQLFAAEVSWEELEGLWQRYRPQTTVIDALPETKMARDFQAKLSTPGKPIYLAYYNEESKEPEPYRWKVGDGTVLIDRTRAIDATFARFLVAESTLPANALDIPNYYSQMKAPIRVVEKTAAGKDIARYVESMPDHYAHAENYCCAASTYTGATDMAELSKLFGWQA